VPLAASHTFPLSVALVVLALLAGCGGDDGGVARDVPGRYPSIQAAVDAARPGDLVRIAPGVYDQAVVIPATKRDVVVRGEDRDRVVLDGGGGRRRVGFVLRGDGAAVENLTIRGFAEAGVLVESPRHARRPLRGWRVSYVTAFGDGQAGVAARGVRGGTVDHVLARGHARAGMLLDDCSPCDTAILDSVADHNRVGFEARDARGNVVVARSRFARNRVGVVLASTRTDEGAEPQRDVTVAGNVIARNDDGRAPGGRARFGIGVLVHGGRRDAVARNLISADAGIGVLLEGSLAGPTAEVSVQGNILGGHAVDLMLAGGARQRTSNGSCFAQNRFSSSQPADIERVLPCQADVALAESELEPAPAPARPGARRPPPPGPQLELPEAQRSAPRPARPPGRIDVARVGLPGRR
jgi:hypothetical protein